MMNNYYLYILKCSDNSYYVGITNNLDRRMEEHNSGYNKDCYTFSRRPLRLSYTNIFNDILQAIQVEKQIKKWSRKKKDAFINGNFNELHQLAKRRTPDKPVKQ